MTVSTEIDGNILTPLFWGAIDNSQANTAQAVQRTLLIGQMLTTGTATGNVATPCGSPEMATELAGRGSMLAAMTATYMANDTGGDVYLLPLTEPTGAAATGSVAISQAATENGVLALYIGGTRVALTVVATDTVDTVGTDLAAAINQREDLPVTAVSAVAGGTATVTLTAKQKGAVGNTLDLRLNYQGSAGGERTPAGMVVTLTAMTGGAGIPELTDALAGLKDQTFDFIVLPYADTTSLDGTVQIENIITTYQKNPYGAPDNSYLEVETLFLLTYIMRRQRTLITSKFGRMKLADDGTRFAAGLPIVTPATIKGALIADYGQMETQGYVQDSKAFAGGLQVTKSRVNPNRVDVLYPDVLINQLRIVALINQFRLQSDSAA
ncbi:hypothetical protein MF265_05685 [Serratia marcescens]|uniref:phage tail sheath C-terminal domain-containing protein n=1 Tax=Serratia marcescens TaxID=615 RepID=UPI001EEF91A5|nr:phage tail sheath C-terminal domain-containing protein [Serratia marcescens]ULH13626.1 hypothetical protein MF265_05685 [Serratia marcescens]